MAKGKSPEPGAKSEHHTSKSEHHKSEHHHSSHRKGPSAIVIKSGQGAAVQGKRTAAQADKESKADKGGTAAATKTARQKLPGQPEDKKKEKGGKKEKKKEIKRGKAPKINKYLAMLGIGHDIILRDPTAIEAAQALDLQQWHLRKLRIRFQEIDIDGSGTIDADEFFNSVGEQRTPFTDKLFSLIGNVNKIHCIANSMLLITPFRSGWKWND